MVLTTRPPVQIVALVMTSMQRADGLPGLHVAEQLVQLRAADDVGEQHRQCGARLSGGGMHLVLSVSATLRRSQL
jgi:hypothetical protein